MLQVWINKLRPLRGDLFGRACVTITRQVDEDEVGTRPAGAAYLEEVDRLSATGGVAGLGDLGARQAN